MLLPLQPVLDSQLLEQVLDVGIGPEEDVEARLVGVAVGAALFLVTPQAGLAVIVVAMVLYAMVGSSRLLSVGPESTTALMTAAVLAPLAAGDPVRYAALAAMLAMLVGLYALLSGVLRLGFIGDLLSRPVLIGYMAGVAVIMISSQLGKVTGVDVDGAEVREATTRQHATYDVGEGWS